MNVATLRCTLILFFAMGSMISFGQSKIDSLETRLKNRLSDSDRVNTLLKLSQEYEYVDIRKSRSLTEEAIEISEKKSYMQGVVDAHQSMGSIYRVSGNYEAALLEDNKSLEASLKMNDSLRIAKTYNNVAHDYYDMGEFDEAYHYFVKSYRYSSALGDSLLVAIALHNIGRVFKELGQYDHAKQHLKIDRKSVV